MSHETSSHVLVYFGDGTAGVYLRKQCLKVNGDQCQVKFGQKNWSGQIIYSGTYTDCREYGVKKGAFKRGDTTPPPRFHYLKDKCADLNFDRVSTVHQNLLDTLDETAESSDLQEIDNILSGEYFNNNKENYSNHSKNSHSTLKVSKKNNEKSVTKVLSILASGSNLNQSPIVSSKNGLLASAIQRDMSNKLHREDFIESEADSEGETDEPPKKKSSHVGQCDATRAIPETTSKAGSNNGQSHSDHRAGKSLSEANSHSANLAQSTENLTMDQVNELLRKQEERWASKFSDLSHEHLKLKQELLLKDKHKKMVNSIY